MLLYDNKNFLRYACARALPGSPRAPPIYTHAPFACAHTSIILSLDGTVFAGILWKCLFGTLVGSVAAFVDYVGVMDRSACAHTLKPLATLHTPRQYLQLSQQFPAHVLPAGQLAHARALTPGSSYLSASAISDFYTFLSLVMGLLLSFRISFGVSRCM